MILIGSYLQSYGIDPDALYSPELSSIQTSFHYGMLAEALGAQEASKITYPELKNTSREGITSLFQKGIKQPYKV
jgi:hypothetical protein